MKDLRNNQVARSEFKNIWLKNQKKKGAKNKNNNKNKNKLIGALAESLLMSFGLDYNVSHILLPIPSDDFAAAAALAWDEGREGGGGDLFTAGNSLGARDSRWKSVLSSPLYSLIEGSQHKHSFSRARARAFPAFPVLASLSLSPAATGCLLHHPHNNSSDANIYKYTTYIRAIFNRLRALVRTCSIILFKTK